MNSLVDAVLEHPNIGVLEVGPDGRLLRANATIERFTGYTLDELGSMSLLALAHPDDQAADRVILSRLMSGELPLFESEKRFLRKDGETVWLHVRVARTERVTGAHTLLGILHNVTERKRIEDELAVERLNIERMWSEASSAIAIVEPDGMAVKVYPGFTRMFGYAQEEVVGANLLDLIASGERRREALQNLRNAVAGEAIDAEGLRRRKDGSLLHVSVLGRSIQLPGGKSGIFVMYRDISARKQLEADLHRLSTTDELTGLRNRRAFYDLAGEELERARRAGHPVVVLYIDLDRLKEINDTHGHVAGDSIIVEAARILRESARPGDIVGRLGGDEFAIFSVAQSAEAAMILPHRIRTALAQANVSSHPWPIELTIGVVTSAPADTEDLDALLTQADRKMYEQKRRTA